MGATKEIALAETERTINCTFKVLAKDENYIENELRQVVNVIDFKVVPDTDYLYEHDQVFRKLVKIEKQAKKEKQEYINKNNKS